MGKKNHEHENHVYLNHKILFRELKIMCSFATYMKICHNQVNSWPDLGSGMFRPFEEKKGKFLHLPQQS